MISRRFIRDLTLLHFGLKRCIIDPLSEMYVYFGLMFQSVNIRAFLLKLLLHKTNTTLGY